MVKGLRGSIYLCLYEMWSLGNSPGSFGVPPIAYKVPSNSFAIHCLIINTVGAELLFKGFKKGMIICKYTHIWKGLGAWHDQGRIRV